MELTVNINKIVTVIEDYGNKALVFSMKHAELLPYLADKTAFEIRTTTTTRANKAIFAAFDFAPQETLFPWELRGMCTRKA